MSVILCLKSKSIIPSIMGLPLILRRGFGMVNVRGKSLVPLPPAIIIADMGKLEGKFFMKLGLIKGENTINHFVYFMVCNGGRTRQH